ncbi:MAG: polysaccharide biosynthesis C-terminal domain-containing protein [Hyphomicrobiaceae bacterium]
MLVNVVVSVALFWYFSRIGIPAPYGIAIATAAGWVNAILLFVLLRRRGHFELDARLRCRRADESALASAVMGAALWFLGGFLAPISTGEQQSSGGRHLSSLVMVGMVVFGVVCEMTGAARHPDRRRPEAPYRHRPPGQRHFPLATCASARCASARPGCSSSSSESVQTGSAIPVSLSLAVDAALLHLAAREASMSVLPSGRLTPGLTLIAVVLICGACQPLRPRWRSPRKSSIGLQGRHLHRQALGALRIDGGVAASAA